LKADPQILDFVYLQPPLIPLTPKFDPYELEIVSHNQITSKYFYTMSTHGVTLFRDGEAGSYSFDLRLIHHLELT
jgi:hypothetical protein